MTRIYKRKENPLTQKVTVPLTTASLEKLRERADAEKQTPTAVARGMIERGLETAK